VWTNCWQRASNIIYFIFESSTNGMQGCASMEYASLYVSNVACEMEDAKEVKLTALGTVKATVVPDLEVYLCVCVYEILPNSIRIVCAHED